MPKSLPVTELPDERQMLTGALCGKRYPLAWNQSRETVDFYDAKGVVEVLLAKLGISGYQVVAGEYLAMHPGKCALFQKDGEIIAAVGEAHPKVLDAFGINRTGIFVRIACRRSGKIYGAYRQIPSVASFSGY